MRMGQQDNERASAGVALAASVRLIQIARVNLFGSPGHAGPAAPRAPYSLEPTAFPFPALAALAGRASLGGPREVALACLVAGRLVIDSDGQDGLSGEQRRLRAQRTRHWLGSVALPQPVRASLIQLAEATAGDDWRAVGAALDAVMTVTANLLDQAARLELEKLAQAVAAQSNSSLLSR